MLLVGLGYPNPRDIIQKIESNLEFEVKLLPVVDLDESLTAMALKNITLDIMLILPHLFSKREPFEIQKMLSNLRDFLHNKPTSLIFLDVEANASLVLKDAVFQIFGGDFRLSYKLCPKLTARSVLDTLRTLDSSQQLDEPAKQISTSHDMLMNSLKDVPGQHTEYNVGSNFIYHGKKSYTEQQMQRQSEQQMQRQSEQPLIASGDLAQIQHTKQEIQHTKQEIQQLLSEAESAKMRAVESEQRIVLEREYIAQEQSRIQNERESIQNERESIQNERESIQQAQKQLKLEQEQVARAQEHIRKEREGLRKSVLSTFFSSRGSKPVDVCTVFDNRYVILVTGFRNCGKTTITKLLSEVFNRRSKPTLAIDTDIVKPDLSLSFGNYDVERLENIKHCENAGCGKNVGYSLDTTVPVLKYLDVLMLRKSDTVGLSDTYAGYEVEGLLNLIPIATMRYQVIIIDMDCRTLIQNPAIAHVVNAILWVVPSSLKSIRQVSDFFTSDTLCDRGITDLSTEGTGIPERALILFNDMHGVVSVKDFEFITARYDKLQNKIVGRIPHIENYDKHFWNDNSEIDITTETCEILQNL